MNEQIEKLEHGLMVCKVTGTELVHIEKEDVEKILGLLKEQEKQIERLEHDLAVAQNNLNYYVNGND